MKDIEENILPRLGTEFFINKEESRNDWERHFKVMSENGIKIVRLFVLWAHIEPKKNIWDFSGYDDAYELAEQYGIEIVSTLTCEDPPGWMNQTPFYHNNTNLNSERVKIDAQEYIRQTVLRYKDKKAHYGWILMNEPDLLVEYNEDTMIAFRSYLNEKYKTIDSLNDKWFNKYKSFDDISVTKGLWDDFWSCFQSFIDWNDFLCENLCDHLLWIKSIINKYDAKSITHINPKNLIENQIPFGQDVRREAKTVDIIGASIHPAWNFIDYDYEDYGRLFSFFIDYIRSCAEGKAFWVTELQSGSTVKTGNNPYCPTPDEFSSWIWNSIGAGAKAIIYWMWHPRTFAQECGEWGLVSNDFRASKRLIASKNISDILLENKDFFEKSKPLKNRIALYFSNVTEILTLIEGPAGNRQPKQPIRALIGMYFILSKLGYSVDIISDSQIQNGELKNYSTLIFPYSYALKNSSVAHIKDYVENGGKIIADSMFNWKDEFGFIVRAKNSLLEDLCDIELNEYYAARNTEKIVCSEIDLLAYKVIADIKIKDNVEVLGTLEDGSPIFIKNNYKKGSCIFIGTALSIGAEEAVRNKDVNKFDCYCKLIDSLVYGEYRNSLFEIKSKNALIQKTLVDENSALLILSNWNEKELVSIKFNKNITIKDLISRKIINTLDNCYNFEINYKETKVLMFQNITG